MVDVLVILDGASEPRRAGPTSLEAARTPVLDGLAAEGDVTALNTVPTGLPAGSETAIPVLLGWTPPTRVDRGALEAAARGIEPAAGERAWRVDAADADEAARAAEVLRARLPAHRVHRLGGHRLLVCGRPPLPDVAGLRAWPEGAVPPRVLDERTTVSAARGAAAGAARLMGARVVNPPGATGLPDSDFGAKATYARAAIAGGARRVVVHVGAPDEAAHQRDRALKIATIERADREILGPVAQAVALAGGSLRVCPDHGCDPETGEHDAAPVPCVTWERRT